MQISFVLDPGHGGHEPAGRSTASGVRGARGRDEKDLTLDIARRVQALLRGRAVLTRNGDVNRTIADRVSTAARSGAPVFVSIHLGDVHFGRGRETYVHTSASVASMRLAQAIDRELERIEPGSSGVQRGELAVLMPGVHHPSTAACLIEVGRLGDPHSEMRFGDPQTLDAIAGAIARGLDQYIPNLSFGPKGIGGPILSTTDPLATQPTGISWTAYNDTDATAGSYTDTVLIECNDGDKWSVIDTIQERNTEGVRPRSSKSTTIIYNFPREGTFRVRVKLNSGVYPIPEEAIDDNEAVTAAFRVWPAPVFRGAPRFGYGVVSVDTSAVSDRASRVYSGATMLGSLSETSVSFNYDELWVVLYGTPSTDASAVTVTLTDDWGNNPPSLCTHQVPVRADQTVVLRFSGFPKRPDNSPMKSCKVAVDNSKDRGTSNIGVEIWA